MGDPQVVVASAVILPEPTELPASPQVTKRRDSSTTEGPNKRPRLGNGAEAGTPDLDDLDDQAAARRMSGQLEERKRGQRLFGALLGTLSQSSSSTAQKRRVDIEQKQQAKLKLQAEEYNEKKKQKLDALIEIRRQEQKKYDKQSMQIRHSNLLATARFLKTKAEPPLYYKPWQLTPSDEAQIEAGIKEVEALIEQETSAFQDSEPPKTAEESTDNDNNTSTAMDGSADQETVGSVANQPKPSELAQEASTNSLPPPITNEPNMLQSVPDSSKDHVDDGGEVLEADEDTVIY